MIPPSFSFLVVLPHEEISQKAVSTQTVSRVLLAWIQKFKLDPPRWKLMIGNKEITIGEGLKNQSLTLADFGIRSGSEVFLEPI
jgi:hypothetical protein